MKLNSATRQGALPQNDSKPLNSLMLPSFSAGREKSKVLALQRNERLQAKCRRWADVSRSGFASFVPHAGAFTDLARSKRRALIMKASSLGEREEGEMSHVRASVWWFHANTLRRLSGNAALRLRREASLASEKNGGGGGLMSFSRLHLQHLQLRRTPGVLWLVLKRDEGHKFSLVSKSDKRKEEFSWKTSSEWRSRCFRIFNGINKV